MAQPDFQGFPAATIEFLDGIAAHNEKPWFDDHRALYEAGYVEPARAFVAAMGPRLRELSPGVMFDPKVNGSIGRINRDIRFSKNKQPYKTHLAVWFWHGDRRGWDRPGFYFHLGQDGLFLGVGMHGLAGEVLESFRQSVIHPRSAKALLKAVEDVETAGPYTVGEQTRKQMPRGYAPDGPAARFLLFESLHAGVELPREAARSADFLDLCFSHFTAMWPIGKWLLDEVGTGD
jgi:uncharacterized protein (TIGR02453 family)